MARTDRKDRIEEKEQEKKPYEPPAIIHEGIISTRAGSPGGLTGDAENNVVDPADLFGNGN
jgi:hypothetical protein